jgi:PhnB protein
MKQINPYLTFDGKAREAMTFYAKCLGADLQIQTFDEVKMDCGPGGKDRVVHARLEKGAAVLLASDTMPGMPLSSGNNFSVAIQCDSADEVEKFYHALVAGGKPTMPPQDTFWNARFAMATDRFGINWMFNFDKAGRKA